MHQSKFMEILGRIPLFKNLNAAERRDIQKMARNIQQVQTIKHI